MIQKVIDSSRERMIHITSELTHLPISSGKNISEKQRDIQVKVLEIKKLKASHCE